MKSVLCFALILFSGTSQAFPAANEDGTGTEESPKYTPCEEEIKEDQGILVDLKGNTNEEDDSLFEFDGDLEIPKVMLEDSEDGLSRNLILSDQWLWPRGTVEYVIDPYAGFNYNQINLIRQSVNELANAVGCLRFIELQPGYEPRDRAYVKIIDDNACYSKMGMVGMYYYQHGQSSSPAQTMSLGKGGCMYKHTIQHEFMHALGFAHEQTRGDRDYYINIYWGNIRSGMEHNFQKYNWRTVSQYDYGSLMHYPAFAFSKDQQRSPTMARKDGSTYGLGNQQGPSAMDIYAMRTYYCR